MASIEEEETAGESLEAYDDLAIGEQVIARMNDAGIPAGAIGVVLRRVAETGNWILRFDLAGGRRVVVALCPWQVRPVSVTPPPVGPDVIAQRRLKNLRMAWQQMNDPSVRARAIEGTRAFHHRRHREIETAGVKRCSRCRELRPLGEFNRRTYAGGHVGYQGYCRTCTAAWYRERRASERHGERTASIRTSRRDGTDATANEKEDTR